jgi:hypothetical protein
MIAAAAAVAAVVADVDLNVQVARRDIDGSAKRDSQVDGQPDPHERLHVVRHVVCCMLDGTCEAGVCCMPPLPPGPYECVSRAATLALHASVGARRTSGEAQTPTLTPTSLWHMKGARRRVLAGDGAARRHLF